MMNDGKQQSAFLFHDYKTFDTHLTLDRPAQSAAIRIDSEFNVTGEPEVSYCKLADDHLPQPGTVLITNITPRKARARGENEVTLVARTHSLSTIPKTCILGYNNVRFGDEVTRNIFYRNFYDPYAWNWQYDNLRRDLLDVMHACYALRLEGIDWPENDDGPSSFRLEHLTKANGIEHSNAHSAMADAHATIAMAKLVRVRRPRPSDYLLIHRNKHKLMALIDVPRMKPLAHVSRVFGAQRGNINWMVPLAWHPGNRNVVIIVDLAGGISPLLELDNDILRECLYAAKTDLGDNAAVPVKLMYISKCLAPAQTNTLRPEDAGQLGINRQYCLDNLRILRENPQVREEVAAISAEAEPFMPSDNVDAQLYNGFFSDADRVVVKIVLETEPRNLPTLDITLVDKRIGKLLFNYRARNLSGMLDYAGQRCWLEHRRQVFMLELLQGYIDELQTLAQQYADDKKKVTLLEALWQYAEETI